jgi:hypothetical protein
MLHKKLDEVSGKVLKTNSVLGFKGIFNAAAGYVRPPETGSQWWLTTTTIWPCDELIGRRIRDWRRLLGETGHSGTRTQTMRGDHDSLYTGTHSVFPAPLCEWILLRYAGSSGSTILDAFSGGPPRACVAAFMGYRYVGYDIRSEQIDENKKALKRLGIKSNVSFICGDGCDLSETEDNSIDFSLTCPPYYNLEQYSDLPNDLSNLPDYDTFNQAMLKCAHSHIRVLKPGAFVCFVVGDFRMGGNKDENELISFSSDTIRNFKEAGFMLWQSVILSKNFASAACRSTTSWKGSKLIPRHEYLLVFRKRTC